MSQKGPIFIVGCQRSGTSALWKALCQHPNLKQQGPEDDGRPVSTMKELWFLREFFLGRQANRSRPHAGTEIDEEFKMRFGRLVDQFCKEKYAGPSGRWISAHPADGLFADQILDLYPDAKMLFLMRHPQEVVWSNAHAPWVEKMTRKESIKFARSSAGWWRRFGEMCLTIQNGKFRERIMVVRHERMISHVIKLTHEVLKFVGEPYHENVISSLGKVFNSSFLKDDTKTQLIVQTRKIIGKNNKFCKVVVSEIGDLMKRFDYKDLSGGALF